jgi:integrase
MSVYKRPGAEVYSYDFRWRGNRFSGSTECKTKREAERFEEAERTRVKSAGIDRSKPMTFAVASTLYWNEVGQFHRNSSDTKRALGWLQTNVGMNKLVSAISDAEIARLVAKRRGDGVSNATVNRSVCEPLRAVLKRAGKTWKQSVQDIDWRSHVLNESQERVREATPGEETKLIAAMRPDYRPVVQFAILTGCRMNEILGLKWAKVDFFNRQFTVFGKGDKSRTIPMTQVVFDLLTALRKHDGPDVFTYQATKTRDGKVRGYRYPITENGFKTQWRRVKRDSGVEDFRFHDTRHTAATRLVRATGNLKLAQRLLGHTEIATTSRYAHVTDADLRAGMEAANPTGSATNVASPDDKALRNNGNVV